MIQLLKLFGREGTEEAPETRASQHSEAEIRDEYGRIVAHLLDRARIDPACVQVDIRDGGVARDGLRVLMILIRMTAWERASSLRLMLGLPHLEREARKAAVASWVAEVSHFGGLWLHPSTPMLDREVTRELGQVLADVESAGGAHPDGSVWASLPP